MAPTCGVNSSPWGSKSTPTGAFRWPATCRSGHPKKALHCTLQVGWCGGVFVLPDTVIGPDAGSVIFQSGERGQEEYRQGGTLDGWRAQIAARAVGNPLFVVGLSAAFAGPMLARCHAENGGLHFVGHSSSGKTTILKAACSVWGGPEYRRSWRATANGMEGAAALFNDCLLGLDEINECEPRDVGRIVYSLGNGCGKQRAGRSGTARAVTHWRTFVVSTGERTLETLMADGGLRSKAGQAVRLLDIPTDRRWGCFRRAARSEGRRGLLRCDPVRGADAPRTRGPGLPGAAGARSAGLCGASRDPQGLARLQPPGLRRAGAAGGGPLRAARTRRRTRDRIRA
jgi:hypothetical protein